MEEKKRNVEFIDFDFRAWIQNQPQKEYDLVVEDDDHYRLLTKYGRAEINFYPNEIVEISITSFKDNEPKYYLHFQLKDEEHTKTLFYEMEQALETLESERKIKVLLSCSSGFTTSFFASRLTEAADTLDLDYTFDAVSYFDLYDQAENYDIVLLAPQIGYMLKKLSTSMPNKLILQIPTAVFASYNAMSALEFIQTNLRRRCEKHKKKKKKEASVCRCAQQEKVVLSLAELYDGNKVTLFFRVYDRGTIMLDDVVIKADFNSIPLWDTIDYCLSQYPQIELITIAFPGEVNEQGVVNHVQRDLRDYPLGEEVQARYGMPAMIVNNVNAAVVGYGVEHPEYKNITFHSQPYGKPMGGQGNLVNGTLVTGLSGIGGELKYFLGRMQFSDDPRRLARTEQGQIELVINALLPTIALLGPEVVVLRTPMVNDMQSLEKRLANFIPAPSIPKLEFISDVNELIFEGSLQLCGQWRQKQLEVSPVESASLQYAA